MWGPSCRARERSGAALRSQPSAGWRLRVVLCLTIIAPALAVDRSKFRTCKQGSFCRRYQKFVKRVQKKNEIVHEIDSGSIVHEANWVSARLKHTQGVENGTNVVPQLSLRIGFFRDDVANSCGVLRVMIQETASSFPRFQIRDGDIVPLGLSPDEVVLTSQSEAETVAASTSEAGCKAVIRYHPFEVDLLRDGHVLQRLNGRHFLNYEQFRIKGTSQHPGLVDATDVDSGDLWEEQFGEHVDSKPRGPTAVGIDVTFEHASVLTGLAEHATRLHLAAPNFSEPYRIFNLDVFEYETDVPMGLYGNVPMVMAVHQPSEGGAAPAASGFLMLNPSEGFVKVDGPTVGGGDTQTWWIFESGLLDMFAFLGPSPHSVLQQYHTVTGWPRMPLQSALGKHQSRWNYIDVDDVLQVDADFDKHRIPFDYIWLDLEHTDGKKYFTWDPKHFSNPDRMLDALAKKHRKVITIIDPHLKGDANYTPFARMQEAGVLTRDALGKPYEGFCWPGPSFYPDFCDPVARDVWAKLFDPAVYPHSRPELYTWNDMNEPSVFNGPEISMPRDNLHKCHLDDYSVEHREVHNLYGFYHHAATVQGQLHRAPDVRPFTLTRSFFAGSHRHGPVWTGDNMAKWSHLARSVPMLVSLALCGLSFAGADVPGFFGDPTTELFIRWHQLGIWYPFYRAHAHLTSKRREPWLFGKSVTRDIRDSVLTRYQLLPLWYTLAFEWAASGSPMIRPIWYSDLRDVQAYGHADDHFLVGEALLVRAITKPGASALDVYLPQGQWFDYWDESATARAGGRVWPESLHATHVPVFVREGLILFKKMRPRRSTGPMTGDPYTVVVYGTPARGRVYIDDGRTHAFEKGAFIYEELSFDGVALRASPAALNAGPEALRRVASPTVRDSAAVAQVGRRVEQLRLLGLSRRPLSAWLVPKGSKAGDASATELRMQVQACVAGTAWNAIVKDPGLVLGGDSGSGHVELLY